MKVSKIVLRNFRRLQDVEFTLEPDSTLFVGPNNSGKTSATAAFRVFFKRSEFTINDFNVSCIHALNDFGAEVENIEVPKVQLDLWLTIDPSQIEFARAFSLLSYIPDGPGSVGIRLSFEVADSSEMQAEFLKTFPKGSGKTLVEYLSLGRNLLRHYNINYYALHNDGGDIADSLIEPEEGRRVLESLIRLDFIDAQRNIHDQESGRHNRLSAAFAAYYKHNLEKPAENEAATKVIDENNTKLTAHYDTHFEKLLKSVAKLGVPAAHDRKLRLVSSLNPQDALQGSTDLYYEDDSLNHRLPEAYNGLGFKNLIYMAIQVSHFHSQWMATEVNRPLCQLIFIEEPEVHLHAQVQQVFISNIYSILEETAAGSGEMYVPPQLVISTHSSHVVNAARFEQVRYFRRCPLAGDHAQDAPLIASVVLNLQNFSADSDKKISEAAKMEGLSAKEKTDLEEKVEKSRRDNLTFLRKYMRLTHCDLFFADAALLVEGTVEKLLMSQMIDMDAPQLKSCFVTVLEVGGAYAHKFSSLMRFLGMPYVVITDIDTVDAADARKACRADKQGAKTSNATLKCFLAEKYRDKIVEMERSKQVVEGGSCFVAFQRPVKVVLNDVEVEFHGRTLEETLVYENLNLFREGKISTGYSLALGDDRDAIALQTYSEIRSDTFKKTEFALDVAGNSDWSTPDYIVDGLKWLVGRLVPISTSVEASGINK